MAGGPRVFIACAGDLVLIITECQSLEILAETLTCRPAIQVLRHTVMRFGKCLWQSSSQALLPVGIVDEVYIVDQT